MPNLAVIPTTPALAGAEVELVSVMAREFRMKRALDALRGSFDLILVDCPPSLGLLTVNALAAADEVIIPVQCEYFALEGLGQLLNTITIVQGNLNPSLQIEGVLMTMFDGRLRLSNQIVEEVKKHFGSKVYQTVIPRNVRISEAPSYGKPVLVYDLKCVGSEAYLKLATEIIQRERDLKAS